MDRQRQPIHASPTATTSSIIDIGLVKTHSKCLPGDIVFTPYQVDNIVFHFPLPPVSKPGAVHHSPVDSAMYIGSPGDEQHTRTGIDPLPGDDTYDHHIANAKTTKLDLPLRISSLQPIDPPPLIYEDSHQTANRSSYFTNFQRQETLNKLEDNLTPAPRASHSSLVDTKIQLAAIPRQTQRPTRIGAPPARPAPQRPQREEINPDFQRSSDALRRRAASLRNQHHQHQEQQSTRPRSLSRAQIVLGLQQPEKSVVEQLFDQAVLEFQQQAPHVAEKLAQRKDIGSQRWASRTQRRILMDEQTFYTPGSSWRPTAKVHRSVGGGGSASNITISTPALASRLGVPVGASTQLRIDAFYEND